MATSIKKETLRFLAELKKHNDRAWFAKNKDRFLAASDDFAGFVATLIGKIAKFDRSVAGLDPKDCVFRIYRDIRFSKDKSPYKTNFAAALMGKDSGVAGYYVSVTPGGTFLAGGCHMAEPAATEAIRREISAHGKAFLAIVNGGTFKKTFAIEGEKLKNVPRGFAKDDPMAEHLKYKWMIARHELRDGELARPDLADKCARVFKTMVPFNAFLNGATKKRR